MQHLPKIESELEQGIYHDLLTDLTTLIVEEHGSMGSPTSSSQIHHQVCTFN